jgi:tetratricopeptide (TPR) repeat protein
MTDPLESINKAYLDAAGVEDWAAAVRQAKLAIEVSPQKPHGWIWMAEGLYHWGQHDKALAAIEQALTIDPTDDGSYVLNAKILSALGEVDTSLASYRRAYECSAFRRVDYMYALADAKHFEEARELFRLQRAKFEEDEDTSSIDAFGINLDIDEVLERSWHEYEEDGKVAYVPLNIDAILAMSEVVHRAEVVGCDKPELQTRLDEVRGVIDDQMKRRFGGGVAVPIAAGLIGLTVLFTAVISGDLFPILLGGFYVACVPLYVHAARPRTYKLTARRLRGDGSGGSFLAHMAEGKGATDVVMGFMMGFCCVGMFAPAVVPYHYVRNYLLK